MKEKMRDSLLFCVIHDVVMLNPVARGICKFAESPIGRRISLRVEVGAQRARIHVRDVGRNLLRKAVQKITF